MAKNATPVFVQDAVNVGTLIQAGDGVDLVSIFTAGSDGSIVQAISVAQDNVSGRDFQLWYNDGSIDTLLSTSTIPIDAGFIDAAPAVNVLGHANTVVDKADNAGNRVLQIPSGHSLKGSVLEAVASAKLMYVMVIAMDLGA